MFTDLCKMKWQSLLLYFLLLANLLAACQSVSNQRYLDTPMPGDILDAQREILTSTFTSTPMQVTLTATAKPTESRVKPSFTPEPIETQLSPTESLPNNGVYTFLYEGLYSFLPWNGNNLGLGVYLDSRGMSDPNPTTLGASDALYLIFANFANKMAYWTLGRPGELWVSDLSIKNPSKVFIDVENKYPTDRSFYSGYDINLVWTPDDSYLIIEVPAKPELNLIYNDKTNTIDPWKYTCDQVALSPQTNRLATWCPENGGNNRFAIIEWGGNISYTKTKPQKELVRRGDDFQQIWAWSADGGRIAYFDPNDQQGELSILSTNGEVLVKILPGGAYWKALQPDLPRVQIEPPSPPLQWSENGERLVVYANGSIDHPCPPFIDDITGQNFENVPCWQVIDTQTGEVIWTVMDAIKSTPDELHLEYIKPWSFDFPTISADGKLLAICYRYFGYRSLFIIDLSSKDTIWSEDFVVDNLRWGTAP